MTKAQTPAICLIQFDRHWSGGRDGEGFLLGSFDTNDVIKSAQMLEVVQK